MVNPEYINVYKDRYTDSDLLVFHKGSQAFFVIRGTEKNFIDIIFNFFALPYRLNNFKIHKGFYRKFLGIRKYLLNEYVDAKHKNLEFIFLGHSAGGCVVSIAYYFFKELVNFRDLSSRCFCIGTPAFANRTFMNNLKEVEYYMNSSDPILLIPMKLLSYAYSKTLKILKTDSWFFKIKDHLPSKYKKTIKEVDYVPST